MQFTEEKPITPMHALSKIINVLEQIITSNGRNQQEIIMHSRRNMITCGEVKAPCPYVLFRAKQNKRNRLALREKCPDTEFFLDWICIWTEYRLNTVFSPKTGK